MKSTPVLSSLWLASLYHQVVADTEPYLIYNIHTIKGCSFWYDNIGTRTCESIRQTWDASPEDFARWNPDLTVDCKGWETGHSYCVAVMAERSSSSTSSTSTTTTTTTTTSPSPIWTDRGCYKDASRHPFQTQLPSPSGEDFTRYKCESACWGADYPFVGFKAGSECWCGNYVAGDLSSSPTDCNVPCPGNHSETCGGNNVFNVVEGMDPPYSYVTTTSVSSTTSTSISLPSQNAFEFVSHQNANCTGEDRGNGFIREGTGQCIDTNGKVGGLGIAWAGSCPSGQVQISYWQNAGCSGEWYGYGYAEKNACNALWSGSSKCQSLWLTCAKESRDCVHNGTCKPSSEPSSEPAKSMGWQLKQNAATILVVLAMYIELIL